MELQKELERFINPAFQNNSDITEKVRNDSKEIEIVSYKNISEVSQMLDKSFIKATYKAIPKECYKNAAEFASLTHGVEYVEGFMFYLGLPIAHAWNSFKGNHFDLTLEMNGRLNDNYSHISLFSLDKSKMREYMSTLGYYGAFGLYHYMNEKVPCPIVGI